MGGNAINIVINATDNVSKTLDDIDKKLGGTFDNMRKNIGKFGAGLTAFGAAGAFGISKLVDSTQESFGVGSAFNNMFGEEAPHALKTLQEATKGTVSDIELMKQANQALLLGIDPNALPEMFEGALAASQATGAPVSKAIADITTGIGRQSKLILDNLGILVSVEKANEDYAKSIGKVVSELTDEEKKMAFTSATMEALRINSERIGEVTDNVAIKTQQANAQWENAKVKLGESLAPAMIKLAELMTSLIEKFNTLSPTTQKWITYIGLAAVALSLIGGPLLILISIIPTIAAAIGVLTTGFGFLAGSLTAVTIAGFPLWAIILAIIAAVTAVILVVKNWDKIMDWFGKKLQVAKEYFYKFRDGVLSVWTDIQNGMAKMVNAVIQGVENMVNKVIRAVNTIIRGINNVSDVVGISISEIGRLELSGFKLDTNATYTPLAGQTTSMGGGVNIVMENVTTQSPDELAEILQQQLSTQIR